MSRSRRALDEAIEAMNDLETEELDDEVVDADFEDEDEEDYIDAEEDEDEEDDLEDLEEVEDLDEDEEDEDVEEADEDDDGEEDEVTAAAIDDILRTARRIDGDVHVTDASSNLKVAAKRILKLSRVASGPSEQRQLRNLAYRVWARA